MKTLNEMKLSFPSKSQNEAFARAAVSAFIAPLDPTVGELSDLKTAVSEAVTNCVVHGYRRQGGEITINGIPLPEQERLGIFSDTKAVETGIRYPVSLESGQYFILGDDRDSARDSRVYGAVDRSDVKGVIFILIRRQAV